MNIAHRGMEAIVTSTVFTTLALIVVCVRLYTRFFIVRFAGLEDYFAICGMFFSIGFTICIAIQADYGMGHHIKEISPIDTRKSLKAFWVSLSSYYLSLTFIKTSILLQYKRVFISKKFQTVCWIILVINGLFGIWCVIGSVFACRPILAFWTRQPDAQCFNQLIMWFTNAAFIIATDFALIILPMPVIRHLNLAPRQKHALIAIFAVGGFVCLVSILRLQALIAIANSTDPTYTNSPAATWTSVEINVGMICACLPVLRPLIARRFPSLFGGTEDDGQRSPNSNGHIGSRYLPRPSAVLGNLKSKRQPSVDSDEEKFPGGIEVVTAFGVSGQDLARPVYESDRPVYESDADDSKEKLSTEV